MANRRKAHYTSNDLHVLFRWADNCCKSIANTYDEIFLFSF